MVNKPQYARTVDVQKTSQQTSSATPKTINLPEQKKQTRILKQKQAGASINQKLEAQRLYEKALKDLPKSGLDYNKRSTDFNKWVMMNQSVLSDPNNIEKAKKLIKNEENTLSKINKRDYNKVTGEVTIDGDYNERVEKLNTIIKDNEEVLTRGNNLEKTQKLFNIEKTKLDNYSKSIPINSAQEFNSNEFIKYNWDTGKNEIISPEKYNINYYDTGKIKSIKAKLVSFTTEYNYKKGSGAKSKDASYSPREIYFDKDGNILKEVQYRTYLDYENKDQERTSRKDKVYKSSEKIYGKNGILKSFNTWDDYKSYREKDGKDKYNQEKVYLESQKLYDPSGNLTTQKEWKDIQTEYNKYNGGYEREREVYLDKEYDYLKGTKTDYPSLGQNFMTYDLTQAEVKAAKSAPKESTVTINNSALITSEGKRIQSSNLDWLKEQQKTRGGFILDKGTYNESGINQTVSINKLLKAKSESNTMITAQDIKNATGTLDINSNLLQSTSDYNDQLKMYQNVNELIRAKGGNQGITAGELSAAVGGLGNLRGQDNLIESVAEISKANLVQLKREKQIKAEMDKEFEKKKPQFYDIDKGSVMPSMLLDLGPKDKINYADKLTYYEEKIVNPMNKLTSKKEYQDFTNIYFKDDTTSQATKKKLQEASDEKFLEQYRSDYNKLNQDDLIRINIYSDKAKQEYQIIRAQQQELDKAQLEQQATFNRFNTNTEKLSNLYQRDDLSIIEKTKLKRKIEAENKGLAKKMLKYDSLLPARTKQLTPIQKILQDLSTFKTRDLFINPFIGFLLFDKKEKPTLKNKQDDFINKKAQSDFSFVASMTPIYKSTFGNIGKGFEKIGYGLENAGESLIKEGKARELRTEELRDSAEILRTPFKNTPRYKSAAKSDYEIYSENMIRSAEGSAKLTSIQSKLFKGAGKTLKFTGGMSLGAGKEYRTKPWKTFAEFAIGAVFGVGGVVSPALGAGIKMLGGARSLMVVKGSAKTLLFAAGATYATGSALRVSLAPKSEKSKVIGSIGKELITMSIGGAAGSAAASRYKPRLDLYQARMGIKYKAKGNQGLIKFRSPIKISEMKNPFKSTKTTNPLTAEFQSPLKINILEPKTKSFLKEIDKASPFKELESGKIVKTEGKEKIQTKLEYASEIAGYSDLKFDKFMETGKNLPSSYVKPYLREQTLFPNKLDKTTTLFSEEGVSGIKSELIQSDIGYFRGEPIKAKKISSGKNYKKVEYQGIYNKDLKLSIELSPEGQITKKRLGTGKDQIVDVQGFEPNNIFELVKSSPTITTPKTKELAIRYEKELAMRNQKGNTPYLVDEIYTQFGKERFPAKLSEGPGDFLLLKESKIPIEDLKLTSLGSKTVGGKKVFIFETTNGKRIEIPEIMIKDKMIDAKFVNSKITPFTREVTGKFDFFQTKSEGQESFSIFGTKIKTDVTAAKIRATKTVEKMGPVESKYYRESGSAGKKLGQIEFATFEPGKDAGASLFEQPRSGIEVFKGYGVAKKGGKGVQTYSKNRGITEDLVMKEPPPLKNNQVKMYKGVSEVDYQLWKKTGVLDTKIYKTIKGDIDVLYFSPSKKIATKYANQRGSNRVLEITIDENLVKSQAGKSKKVLLHSTVPAKNVKEIDIFSSNEGKQVFESQPYYVEKVLETSRPEATNTVSQGLESFNIQTSSKGYRKIPVYKDGKLSLDFRDFTRKASKKLKGTYSDIIDINTNSQKMSIFEKGKVDKASLDLFKSMGPKTQTKTVLDKSTGQSQEQVLDTQLEIGRKYETPKLKSKTKSAIDAITESEKASSKLKEKTIVRQRIKQSSGKSYGSTFIPPIQKSPKIWQELRGQSEFFNQRDSQSQFNKSENKQRFNSILKPISLSKNKQESRLNSDLYQDLNVNINQDIRQNQNIKPISVQDISQKQSAKQMQRLRTISKLDSVGEFEGIGGYSPYVPTPPSPPRPPEPPKPKKPKNPLFNLNLNNNEKPQKKRKFRKGYSEKTFKILDLLSGEKRAKQFKFL